MLPKVLFFFFFSQPSDAKAEERETAEIMMGGTSLFQFICFWVTGAADLSADAREPLTRRAPTPTYCSWEGQPPPQQQGGVQEGVRRTRVGQKEKLDGNNEAYRPFLP